MEQDKDKVAGHHQERERIKGVFSTQEVRKVGTGTTTRKTVQKAFWMVEEGADSMVEVQPLNSNYVPSGPKRCVPVEEVLNNFQPEPEFYVETVFPKMQELSKTVARADMYRARGEHFTAEFEYGNALKVDEGNIRANFGLGLTYLERGDVAKADDIFERLVKLDAAFAPEHKHLFNDFGINLRKSSMFEQAVEYYKRALELSADDENLHYNMARVYLEQQEYTKAMEHLFKCLEANPGLEAATRFLEWMKNKGLIPEGMQDAYAKIVRTINAHQAHAGAPSDADAPGEFVEDVTDKGESQLLSDGPTQE